MPRAHWWSKGGGLFLMGEKPLHTRTGPASGGTHADLSLTVFQKSSCKSQLPYKFVSLSCVLVITKNKLTDSCENGPLHNNYMKTVCEIRVVPGQPANARTRLCMYFAFSVNHLIQDFELRVEGSGFRVAGSGFRVQGSGVSV